MARNNTYKRRLRYNRLGMLCIAMVVLILLGVLMMQSRTLEKRLSIYNARAASLEEQIEDEIARTEEINELKAYMETDEYAEEAARNRLGLVKENEIVFKERK